MPTKQSKAFAASQAVRKAPQGGKAVSPNEIIKTSLILRRKEDGGAEEDDVAKAYRFLAENHLTVVEGSTPEETLRTRMINVGASLQDYRNAGVDPGPLRFVKTRGATHRVRTGALKIPASLQEVLLSWTGFDTQPAAKPHSRMFRAGKKVGPHTAGNASFAVPALAELYGFPTSQFTGKGQSIAIIELNDWDSQTHQPTGTGYAASDLSAYFKRIKTKAPTVIPVGVLGGANVPGLDPDTDGEVALDIEVAGAVAPEATIVVYFAPNTDRGFVAAVQAAVFDTVHKPSVISISWGSAEDFTKKQYRDAFNAVLQDAAAHNITVFVSSGDSGSSDIDPSDGKPHVDFPGSNDKAISCGGLKTSGNLAETVWNDGSGAGGGGVSNLVSKPPYQSGIGVPKSPKGFTGRGVPDVSGDADPATGYQIVVGGKKQVFGGTSAVAPLYAGLLALINESRAIKGKAPAGDIHSAIYTAPAAFRDIAAGDNDTFGNLGKYQAVHGWDPATGLGSPKGDKLLALLG